MTLEAAEVLAVTPKTIRRWLQQGILKGANTNKDIQQFLKKPSC